MNRGILRLGVAAAAVWPLQSALAQAPLVGRPGWLPRQVQGFAGLTRAQRAAALATVDRIERLLGQVPELANPHGFEVQPIVGAGPRHLGPGQKETTGTVVSYGLTLMFFHPTRAAAGEGCHCITVTVNADHAAGQPGDLADPGGDLIYIEAARAQRPRGDPDQAAGILWEVPAATQVYGELWEPLRDIRAGRPERSGISALFVDGQELPWAPVSREVFYQAVRRSVEGPEGNNLGAIRHALAKTPYEEWMEGAAGRKRDREEALRAAATFQTAAELANTRAAMEASEREVTERLRAAEAEHRVRMQAGRSATSAFGDRLAADLERMSAVERQMPTYINNALEEGPVATGWRLSADSAPPAWRVLTPNHDFWRARRSPVEVRTITVSIGISGTGLRPPVRHALLETFKRLDWAAFRTLLAGVR